MTIGLLLFMVQNDTHASFGATEIRPEIRVSKHFTSTDEQISLRLV